VIKYAPQDVVRNYKVTKNKKQKTKKQAPQKESSKRNDLQNHLYVSNFYQL
jgi:hypothetical protein